MKKWTVGMPDKKIVSKLMLGCSVDALTAAVLANKGYSTPESVMEQLNVNELSDPFLIKDMSKAAEIINEAIDSGERICVYGDYDCDGIMSTVILYSYLAETGADVTYYIPERSEGYGLNKNAIDSIAGDGVSLVVTVDNGITAVDEAKYLYEKGMRLIVTDHHQQGDSLPKAEAVVDPHRRDCFSPFKYMCGAGIALKLIAALDGGDYTMALEQFGDLAAIATVADIVSLTGENRFLVSYGLELINNTDRPALIALKQVCGLEGKTTDSQTIGFGIAPRINASGRFGSPKTAAELFLCESIEEALPIAQELDTLNTQRKTAESHIVDDIYRMIDEDPMLIRGRTIFLCGKDWHHGVIGIVASRIMEQFGKPCFIASESAGEIRGSARSFGDFSIFSALSYAAAALDKFGGHPSAGGFTIKNGKAGDFASLIERFAAQFHSSMPVMTVAADCLIAPQDITIANVKGLSVLEPFGTDNEKPLFLIKNAVVTGIYPLSDGLHSKLRLKLGGTVIDALLFRVPPRSVCVQTGAGCDLIVTLGINEFRGNTSVSVIIRDIRPADFQQSAYFAAMKAFETFLIGEQLPKNYYPSMLPSRDDAVKIYKNIPDDGVNSDTLYLRLKDPKLNYCKFSMAVEALRQLDLIKITSADSKITKVKTERKADLSSAPVLASLRKCTG